MPKEKLPAELQKVMDQALNPTVSDDFEDGSELHGEDGKVWYRYHVDGETQLLRKKIEDMTEEDWIRTSFSITNVQTSRIPQQLTVKFRDPQWAGRWFNKNAGKSAPLDRINQARYLGFVPAKRDDLDWTFNSSAISDSDGAVEQGDLVLFKIHKAKMGAMLKARFMESAQKGTKEHYLSKAEGLVDVPDNHRENVDFYLTKHALKERQGLGPVESF